MADNSICSVDDCGKSAKRAGLCLAHYERKRRHGDPLAGGAPRAIKGDPYRFYREVVLPYSGDDCLTWPYSRSVGGYGRGWLDGAMRFVHRLACEEVNGAPPTPKHQASHTCGNGHLGCVNPRHLRWKTPKANTADRIIHGTHNRGERHNMSKLTESDVMEIMAMKNKESQKSIAEMFCVSRGTISKIHRGVSWGWSN